MREPPGGISRVELEEALSAQFAIAVAELSFLPLGHDASAWVYRVVAKDGQHFFLKVRTAVTNRAALLAPRHLHDHGVSQVIAPLPTRSGALWAERSGYALILYPFVDGQTGMERAMSADQWRQYGAILRQLHATPPGPELAALLRQEQFIADGVEPVRRLDAYVAAEQFANPEAVALAEQWRERRPVIETLLERAATLGAELARNAPPLLLCHADIHTGNVLVDQAGQVWVVDWDEIMLAPRERDLMFVRGGISEQLVGPHQEEWFFAGYGPVAIDPTALAYYRAAWALSDIGAFGAEICFRPDLGELTRREALRYFSGLFAPGQIVPIALRST